MGKLTSFQIKLIILIVIIIVALITLLLFLTKSMTTINSDINISKMEAKDKIYTYDIYSDFYFNVAKYNEKGEKISQFSQLIPTRTSIGYDFSKEKPALILKNYDNLTELQLISKNDNNLTKEIDVIKNFSKEYGLISAIQDEHYFKENISKTQEILQKLYNIKTKLTFDLDDKFYEDNIPLPINNLHVKTAKLNDINKNLKSNQKCEDEEWCSELLKWQFGEDDIISLEYVTKAEKIDLNDYLREQNKNVIVTKITKINNKEVSKFFMIIPNDKNELRSYFMDNNGYIYLLRYKYQNPKSLKKYQNDYIKIAFGINFVDVQNFENKYAQIQNNLNKYKDKLKKINELDKELAPIDINEEHLFEYYKLKLNPNVANELKLEDIYLIYKNDENYIETILNEYKNKYLLKEAITNIPNFFVKASMEYINFVNETNRYILSALSLSTKGIVKTDEIIVNYFYSKKLKDLCKDLECVKNLRANNWKVEKND